MSGHEGGAVGTHPEDGFGDFQGLAEATDGVEADREWFHFRGAEEAFAHGGFDDRWADGVDADAFGGGFEGSALREREYAVLAGAISCCAGRADKASDGRHVDDGSACALLQHLLDFILEAEPDAFEVDGDGAVPVFLGLLCNRNPRAFNAGVVEGDVEAAILFHGLLE